MDVERRDRDLLRAVGRRVAELRAARGLTQEQFAEAYGASAKYIQLVELGEQNLTLITLAKLARSLKVEPRDLLVHPRSLAANPGRPPRRMTRQ